MNPNKFINDGIFYFLNSLFPEWIDSLCLDENFDLMIDEGLRIRASRAKSMVFFRENSLHRLITCFKFGARLILQVI